MRPSASTRMAIQMAVALTLSFVVGYLCFAERGLSSPIQRAAIGVPTITRIALIKPVAIDSAPLRC